MPCGMNSVIKGQIGGATWRILLESYLKELRPETLNIILSHSTGLLADLRRLGDPAIRAHGIDFAVEMFGKIVAEIKDKRDV